MSDRSVEQRYARVADAFTERVRATPAEAWERPAPCAGWSGRHIVMHLCEWVPAVFAASGLEFAATDPGADPLGAWSALDATLRAALADPAVADRRFDAGPAGEMRVEDAIGMIVLGDVLIHTWDLARTAGLDERLDADEVAAMFAGMEPLDEMLRASGHFGPRVAVPDDADPQTKLLAFTGRTP